MSSTSFSSRRSITFLNSLTLSSTYSYLGVRRSLAFSIFALSSYLCFDFGRTILSRDRHDTHYNDQEEKSCLHLVSILSLTCRLS
uniref:Uncharacterized protein n=1 Tax=Anopheles albimanus TaxID=7167 RepID=A0A182FYF2_ANOAL